MKARLFAAVVAVGLSFCPLSKADVIGVTYHDDGDTGIACPIYTWAGGDTINVYGDQNFGPGHILFDVTTDSSGDPTLTLANAIDNDTAFAWTSYEVDIWMNQPFTILTPSVSLPAGWSVSSVVQPTGPQTAYQDGNPVPNQYIGNLYISGTPDVAIGGSLDFDFGISFIGGATFTEQLIPVPEPGTFGFLVAGMLLLGGLLITGQRKSRS